jgi:hypothetical protein
MNTRVQLEFPSNIFGMLALQYTNGLSCKAPILKIECYRLINTILHKNTNN